jgi:hypothetical protein
MLKFHPVSGKPRLTRHMLHGHRGGNERRDGQLRGR